MTDAPTPYPTDAMVEAALGVWLPGVDPSEVDWHAAKAALITAERAAWSTDMEAAPVDVDVLLYCPERCASNLERIELGPASTSRGSYHSWATKWRHPPTPPEAE